VAVRSGADVLPIVLHGTDDLLPHGSLVFRDVPFGISVLERIPAGDDEDALRERVRTAMLNALKASPTP
jgi:1-acyl-sn-glycerol-3-phosphate acyltransferase